MSKKKGHLVPLIVVLKVFFLRLPVFTEFMSIRDVGRLVGKVD